MKVEVGNYFAYKATGSLKGFFSLLIPAWGNIKIESCRHFVSTLDSAWFKFPEEEYTKKDGTKGYKHLVKIFDKEMEQDLQASVLKAIAEYKLKEAYTQNGKEESDVQTQSRWQKAEDREGKAFQAADDLLSSEAHDLW